MHLLSIKRNPHQSILCIVFDFNKLYVPSLGARSNTDGIEYAISCQNQYQVWGASNNLVASWVIADDINYPRCAPWKGTNAVVANGGNPGVTYPLFKYKKSVRNNSSVDFANATQEIWARSPYGDYLNELYTGATNFTAFIPNAGEEYINLKLDRTAITLDSWTNSPPTNFFGIPLAPAADRNLQFVVGYSSANGKKLINQNITNGVGAKRVFSTSAANDVDAIPFMGTNRISKN